MARLQEVFFFTVNEAGEDGDSALDDGLISRHSRSSCNYGIYLVACRELEAQMWRRRTTLFTYESIDALEEAMQLV